MLTKTLRITNARNAKTLSPSHMKQCIMSESRFDFLRELVKNIPDINVAEEQQGDNYPERHESSEDEIISIGAPVASNSNGALPNPNGSTSQWIKTTNQRNDNIDTNTNASSSSSTFPHWKYSKQNSLDSISLSAKHSNNYSTSSNDGNAPINYSIKIKLDDKPPPPKLLRMESTPASFGATHNMASPIVTPAYVPLATTKLTGDGDKQPIINFDFTKIPLLPSTASTASTPITASNHSHSVSNILKLNDSPSSVADMIKNEVGFRFDFFSFVQIQYFKSIFHFFLFLFSQPHSQSTKILTTVQRSTINKPQPTKSISHSSVSSTITSNTQQPPTAQCSSTSIQISSPSTVPLLSYNIPLSTVGTSSSTLEMDEDYDNI